MIKSQSERGSRERGASLIILALGVVALMAMLALAVDGGFAFSQKRRMQIAADAAAMSGARIMALGGNSAAVCAEVDRYASANGSQDTTCTVLSTDNLVQATASCTFPTFFAGIVGRSFMTATATGEASFEGISEAGNLLPMIVREQSFVVGQTYHLWMDDLEAPGNFGWVDWDGGDSNAVELAENIRDPGRSGVWHIGDWLPGAVAIVADIKVRSALDGWIGQHVTIPLYDMVVDPGGLTTYRISGFAEFDMEYHQLVTGDKKVTGHFINWVEESAGGGPNKGLVWVSLTQ